MKTPIDKLMDAQYISRWAIVGTAQGNNLATHSFNVAMLAMAIFNRMPSLSGRYSEHEICYYALIHDIEEVHTGDIPTPTKAKMLKAGLDINKFDPDVASEDSPEDNLKAVIKAADLIDNYVFIKDNGIGTRAEQARKEVLGRLMAYAGAAQPELGAAMLNVYSHVVGRLSDVVEEGKRAEGFIKGDDETGGQFSHMSILGGVPLNIARNPGC